MALGIGLHFDVDPDAYHRDPTGGLALSASVAHTLISKSPMHAYLQHPKLGGKTKAATKEMDFGSIEHALLLGRGKQFAVVRNPRAGEINPKTKEPDGEFEDWRKKDAQEARDAIRAEGKIPLLVHQAEAAFEVAERLRTNLRAHFGIVLNGVSEVVAIWEEAGVLCRAAFDHMIETDSWIDIYDLKIVRSSHPKACQSHMIGFGGHVQAAAYISAVETLRPEMRGRVRFTNLFCEAEEPHAVTPVEFHGSMRWLGEQRWKRAVPLWERCITEKKWPGYVSAPIAIEAPQYALMAEEAEGATVEPNGSSEATPLNGEHHDEYGADVF